MRNYSADKHVVFEQDNEIVEGGRCEDNGKGDSLAAEHAILNKMTMRRKTVIVETELRMMEIIANGPM
jgi:agmatine/peptidylarginine deiminase